MNGFALTVYLAWMSYIRMLSVVMSLLAVLARDLLAFLLCMLLFGLTTWAISWALNSPTSEDFRNLADAVRELARSEAHDD